MSITREIKGTAVYNNVYTNNANYSVVTTLNPSTHLPGQGSFSYWYKGEPSWHGCQQTNGRFEAIAFRYNDYTQVTISVGTVDLPTGIPWVQNTWHHVACTYDTTGNINVYFNGSFATSAAYVGPLPDNAFHFLGYNNVNGFPDYAGKGTFDEFAFWNRVLSENDISDLYNSGSGLYIDPTENFPTDGSSMGFSLCALWHMDEGSGTTVGDSSVNNIIGTFGSSLNDSAWVEGKVSEIEILTDKTYYIYE